MTNLVVNLSTGLQTQLAAPGAWAYAVYFDSTGANPVWTTLVSDGAVAGGGLATLALPSSLNGGKIYFLLQSQATGGGTTLPAQITTESQINWDNAATFDFRYDSFEVTLLDTPTDAGNLTSVNGFGLPMAVVVNYANGTSASVGYGITGTALEAKIAAINPANTYNYTYSSGPLSGQFRMAVSPTVAVGGSFANAPYSADDWAGYVQSLQGPQAAEVVISGLFNGAKDAQGVWHNGGYFAYQLSWDAGNGVFWLSPTGASQIGGYIRLTPADLQNSIYSTLGNADIFTAPGDATPFLTMNTGENNQWGKVLSEFLTGFTGGFYGGSANSPNPQVTAPIDLDQNSSWDPTFAFGQNSAVAAPTYMASDPYSQVFYAYSNSYGSGYSDALMSQYVVGGPLISVSEPNGTPTAGQNVPQINLTIFADGETPTGYTQPVIHNYIAPTAGVYDTPAGPVAGLNITLNFAATVANSIGVVLPADASVTMDILLSDTGGVPVWSTVTFDGASAGPAGLWQHWTIGFDSGTGQYTAAPSVPPVTMPAGAMLVDAFPAPTDGVAWYRIGAGGKTFNLYTTTSGGQFVNPAAPGQGGALAVDGLAAVTPQVSTAATIGTFSLAFSTGDTVTVPPGAMVLNTALASTLPAPNAPVAGTLAGSTFTALPDQTSQVSNTIISTTGTIAFGWTGYNNDPGTPSWISGYTNKIDAGAVARVTIQPVSGLTVTATGVANPDGEWLTGPVALANGSYTVTMLSYLSSDTGFTTPISAQSSALSLTVTSSEVVPCFAAGTRIATARGEVAVEDLAVGDLVVAADGALVPVAWLGHRRVDCAAHPRPHDVMPVRVRRGAFGPAMPRRDLVLSPDHAVFVDGVLVPVRYLVNGATVVQHAVARVTYWHVELPRHGVLLAEGLPCESYLDTGNRGSFANGGGAVVLHADFALGVWEREACAPLVREGASLAAVQRHLLRRATALGHSLTAAPALSVQAAGRILALEAHQGGWRLTLPEGVDWIVLRSRSWVPVQVRPGEDDARCLGVAVARLWLDGLELDLGDARLDGGWHTREAEWRWTDGAARIRVAGAREVAFALAMAGSYWDEAAAWEAAVA